jgi:hypothetical protein
MDVPRWLEMVMVAMVMMMEPVVVRMVVMCPMVVDLIVAMPVLMAGFGSYSMIMRVTVVPMREVDVEFDSLDAAAELARKVEVEFVTEAELRQLALDHVCRDAEVTEGADRHVAADTGKTIEKECAHPKIF